LFISLCDALVFASTSIVPAVTPAPAVSPVTPSAGSGASDQKDSVSATGVAKPPSDFEWLIAVSEPLARALHAIAPSEFALPNPRLQRCLQSISPSSAGAC